MGSSGGHTCGLEADQAALFGVLKKVHSKQAAAAIPEAEGGTRHYDNVGHYFTDPRLKAAFSFQNVYVGVNPYEAPAVFSLLQYTELADGVWFPMGGMVRVVEALTGIAEEWDVLLEPR